MRTPLLALVIGMMFPLSVQAETINLMELEPDPLRAIEGTLSLPEEPTQAEFLLGKYSFRFEDGSSLQLDKAFDADFDSQKELDTEFNEVETVLDEEADFILYQGRSLGEPAVFALTYQEIEGEGWFCRVMSASEDKARQLQESCSIESSGE